MVNLELKYFEGKGENKTIKIYYSKPILFLLLFTMLMFVNTTAVHVRRKGKVFTIPEINLKLQLSVTDLCSSFIGSCSYSLLLRNRLLLMLTGVIVAIGKRKTKTLAGIDIIEPFSENYNGSIWYALRDIYVEFRRLINK